MLDRTVYSGLNLLVDEEGVKEGKAKCFMNIKKL